jgi:hypothetical protein
MALDRRPWLVLVLRRREQALDRRLLEHLRHLLAQLLGRRVKEVNPGCGHVAAFRRGAG